MSKFFYIENTVTTTLQEAVPGNMPWEFKPVEEISAQIREIKEDRQDWYNNPSTKHYFYTGIEPLNPTLRVNKDQNQAHYIHAFVADYDNWKLPRERVMEAIAKMDVKPAWIEKSLGGNWRLVWTLEKPILVGGHQFCVYILQQATKWLRLDLLPELDENSFITPTRTYCNGCEWEHVGKDVPVTQSHAFLVKCAKGYNFKQPSENVSIPLDKVYDALKAKFPDLEWEGEFVAESQGPSFWIPESKSPKSAIIKTGGIYTFSAHANKNFYSWGDPELLGPAFVKEHNEGTITQATLDVYFDNERWWQKVGEYWCPSKTPDFVRHLKVTCGMSAVAPKDGVSQIDEALEFISQHNRIAYAASFVFRKSGVIDYQNRRVLNTYCGKPVEPHPNQYTFADVSEIPIVWGTLTGLLGPFTDVPLQAWMAWFKYYYESALNYAPCPGTNLIMAGATGTGKTMVNRGIVGRAVGGFIDASNYLVKGGNFNSHCFEHGHWCVDDEESSSGSSDNRAHAAMMFKKMAANSDHVFSKKFEHGGPVEWLGRVGITMNLDFTSMQLLGAMDNNSLDKTCLFLCAESSPMKFPPRAVIERKLEEELPKFLRMLINWEYPEAFKPVGRFGPPAYKDERLLARIREVSPLAPVREALVAALTHWFSDNRQDAVFSGTASQIYKLIKMVSDDGLLRGDVKQITRYLELIHKDKLMECSFETTPECVKIWTFPRFGANIIPTQAPPVVPDVADPNPYKK